MVNSHLREIFQRESFMPFPERVETHTVASHERPLQFTQVTPAEHRGEWVVTLTSPEMITL